MNDYDSMFTLSCGKCRQISPLMDWTRTALGDLPRNHFQCPRCGYAFTRAYNPPKDRKPILYGTGKTSFLCFPTGHITLDPIQPAL